MAVANLVPIFNVHPGLQLAVGCALWSVAFPGIQHDQIKACGEGRLDLCRRFSPFRAVGNVKGVFGRLKRWVYRSQCILCLGEVGCVDVHEGEMHTLLTTQLSDGKTHTRGSAGDESGLLSLNHRHCPI